MTKQPIETAPKDGTAVLAFDPNWYDIPYPMIFNRHGKWVAWYDERGPFYPTHWMPLPPTPQDQPNDR